MSSLLLVHDDPDTLDWLTTLLEANGYSVSIAATAFAVRAHLERNEVSAILMGLEVGAGAGHSLLAWAQKERPELIDYILVLAENDEDKAVATKQTIAAITTTDYAAILTWTSEVTKSGPPRPVTEFQAEAERTVHVLLVEDDVYQTRVMTDILSGYGFAIHSVDSVDEAIARLDASPPIDVVLSDWYLADESGERLYRYLADSASPLVDRCLFISGGSMREIRERAPLASCYPKGQDVRVLIAALTRAARAALSTG